MALVAAGGWLLLGGALHAGLWALAIGLVVGEAAATALREVRSRAPC